MNQMKNKENGIAFCKSTNEEIISETFVLQFLKCVMDSIPTLLEDKKECYTMQTRGQLKNLKNMNMDENEDTNKNKLLINVQVTNRVQKKRGRPRKIIQEVQLHEPIKKRGRPRKVRNESPENDEKRKFIESEDESDPDADYDIKQKLKASKKNRHVKENEDEKLKEEFKEGSYFESNSDLSSENEEEIQENF